VLISPAGFQPVFTGAARGQTKRHIRQLRKTGLRKVQEKFG
jgi:hypothetical protein